MVYLASEDICTSGFWKKKESVVWELKLVGFLEKKGMVILYCGLLVGVNRVVFHFMCQPYKYKETKKKKTRKVEEGYL